MSEARSYDETTIQPPTKSIHSHRHHHHHHHHNTNNDVSYYSDIIFYYLPFILTFLKLKFFIFLTFLIQNNILISSKTYHFTFSWLIFSPYFLLTPGHASYWMHHLLLFHFVSSYRLQISLYYLYLPPSISIHGTLPP